MEANETNPIPSAATQDAGASAVPYPFPYRIFGIGMNKTGTSSLGRALGALGVGPIASQRIVHRTGLIRTVLDHGEYEPALRFAGVYRVFEDRPWNVGDMYRRLDERYPGSRFILTYREPERWWRSVERWITVTKPSVAERYRRHLRTTSLDKADMVRRYIEYNEEVRTYFGMRQDFLMLNFEAGDGWNELCPFLALPQPEQAFPHTNRQRYNDKDKTLLEERAARKLAENQLNATLPLDVATCISCKQPLTMRKKNRRRAWLVKLPEPAKWPYRWLQRTAFNLSEDRMPAKRRYAQLRDRYPDLQIDDMAVVTCFFNPTGSNHRVHNYHRFRERFKACGRPLLTVELAFGNDPWMLAPSDDHPVLQLRTASPMWQKERLLNIGIQRLREQGYRQVVWLDADVVFEEAETWPWFVAAALREAPVCQVFRAVQVEQGSKRKSVPGLSAVRFWQELGAWLDQNPRGPSRNRLLGALNGYSGFGWAARMDLFETVSLYDRAIVGGADKLIFAATFRDQPDWTSQIDKLMRSNFEACGACGHHNQAAAFIADYHAWARQWSTAVGGQLAYADTTVHSLFHGEHQNRHYRLRRDILLRHDYAPDRDLAIDENGCWRWASDKWGLHQQVHGYFFERKDIH